jgi:hypothetical protein
MVSFHLDFMIKILYAFTIAVNKRLHFDYWNDSYGKV